MHAFCHLLMYPPRKRCAGVSKLLTKINHTYTL
uniref:Uncharacterized protein n=1 Tax=Rhizophora mucronata TaxID=61149 RepID=A0A2P2QEE8_RHIMU